MTLSQETYVTQLLHKAGMVFFIALGPTPMAVKKPDYSKVDPLFDNPKFYRSLVSAL